MIELKRSGTCLAIRGQVPGATQTPARTKIPFFYDYGWWNPSPLNKHTAFCMIISRYTMLFWGFLIHTAYYGRNPVTAGQ